MSGACWLESRAAATPDGMALVCDGNALAYRDLFERSRMLADRLCDLGMRSGDRIAVLLPSRVLLVELIHAAEQCGLLLVLLNTRLTVSELGYQIEDSGARWLIHGDGALAETATELMSQSPMLRCVSVASLEAPNSQQPTRPVSMRPLVSEAPRFILYTSGTTGRPKGVVLSSRNFRASADASRTLLGDAGLRRWLLCLPVFHVAGLSILLRAVLAGGTVLLHGRFEPSPLNHIIDEEDVSGISLVATMLQQLLDDRAERPAPECLRCVLLGGGPAPAGLVARAEAMGFPIAFTYGLTEAASQVATRPPGPYRGPPGGGLVPLPGSEIRILAEDKHVLGFDREGEISVRSPSVMAGYWSGSKQAVDPSSDGWLDTGDIGSLSTDGTLRVLDRRSDLIVSGGENIYPAEIECVLLDHPSIAEAAVVGVTDLEFGERPVAWVVLKIGAYFDEIALARHCQSRLAGYKLATRIYPIDKLPRNALGKLIRRKLGCSAS